MSAVMEWTFPSKSSPGTTYTTKRNSDGSLSCNCKGWAIKRGDAPRSCTHTKDIQAKDAEQALNVRETSDGIQRRADARAAVAKSAWLAGKNGVSEMHQSFSGAPTKRAIPAPMLASAMTEPVTGAAFDRAYAGWLMEEKHDGHRISVVVEASGTVAAWSRPGAGESAKPRELPAPLVTAMSHLSPGVYDGELVAPGGNSWDVTVIGARLVFVAFDLLEVDGQDLKSQPYSERREALLDQLRKLPAGQKSVSTVESVPASWALVEKIWKRGGEGAILKRPNSTYRAGYRSPEWIKVKAKRAATLTVTGFEAGKMGPYSKFQLRDASGHETTCKVLGNAMLAAIANDPKSYIGRRIVISYQQKTPGGSYRHGIFDHFAGEGE